MRLAAGGFQSASLAGDPRVRDLDGMNSCCFLADWTLAHGRGHVGGVFRMGKKERIQPGGELNPQGKIRRGRPDLRRSIHLPARPGKRFLGNFFI